MKKGKITQDWLFSQKFLFFEETDFWASFQLKDDKANKIGSRTLEISYVWESDDGGTLTLTYYYEKKYVAQKMVCLKARVFSQKMFCDLVNTYLSYYGARTRFKP